MSAQLTRFLTDDARVAHREELHTVLNPTFGRMTQEESISLLGMVGIGSGSVRSFDEVANDKDRDASEQLSTSTTPRARIDTPSQPSFGLDGDRGAVATAGRPGWRAHLGDHTRTWANRRGDSGAAQESSRCCRAAHGVAEYQTTAHPLITTEDPR